MRGGNREILENYVEVYCRCDVEAAKARDERRLYLQAEVGFIENFTGLDEPYEESGDAEVVLDTDKLTEEECVKQVLDYLEREGYLAEWEEEE